MYFLCTVVVPSTLQVTVPCLFLNFAILLAILFQKVHHLTCGQPNRTAPHAFHFNAQVLPLYKPQHVFETGTTTSGWIKPRLTPVPTHLFICVPFCDSHDLKTEKDIL